MSVYKEGFHAIELLLKQSKQIYPDACDYGAPTKQGDTIWNAAKQLCEMYGDKATRKSDAFGVNQKVTLIDEWAVSDHRKTVKEATETYQISYVYCTSGECKGKDGFISVDKIEN